MNWHQQQAARRAWKTRNLPAHIIGDNGKTLCGLDRATVTIDPEHRGNPANQCCKTCKRVADKF